MHNTILTIITTTIIIRFILPSKHNTCKYAEFIAPFDRLHMSSYSRTIVTMALSCIISETMQDMVENRDFFMPPPAFDATFPLDIAIRFGKEELECWLYQMVKKFDNVFTRFDRIHERDR